MVTDSEWQELKKKERILKKAAEILRVEEKDLPKVIERFLREINEMNLRLSGERK